MAVAQFASGQDKNKDLRWNGNLKSYVAWQGSPGWRNPKAIRRSVVHLSKSQAIPRLLHRLQK